MRDQGAQGRGEVTLEGQRYRLLQFLQLFGQRQVTLRGGALTRHDGDSRSIGSRVFSVFSVVSVFSLSGVDCSCSGNSRLQFTRVPYLIGISGGDSLWAAP